MIDDCKDRRGDAPAFESSIINYQSSIPSVNGHGAL
jgi:hypothetical protein